MWPCVIHHDLTNILTSNMLNAFAPIVVLTFEPHLSIKSRSVVLLLEMA
jgi:hypothetical protein